MDTNIPNNPQEEKTDAPKGSTPMVPRRSANDAPQKPATETRVVQQEGNLLLVEWHSGHKLRRAWVTADMVEAKTDNAATVREPGEGVPYGVEWHRLVELQTTPIAVENELHARGIWTLADLRSRPQEVVAAIAAAYSFSRSHLLQAAERYEEKLKTEVKT